MSTAAHSPPAHRAKRRIFTSADNPVVRAVAKLPAKLRTKLLAAFLAIAALLVLVSLLGVRVLGQSNSRSEGLKALQNHRAGYQAIQAQATIVRDILALCAGGDQVSIFTNGKAPHANRCLRSKATVVETSLIDLSDSAQLGFRLPNIVISPFTRKHYVSHTPMDETASLRFMEARWSLPTLTARDAAMPDMTEFFDFTNKPWATPPSPPPQNTNGTCDFSKE